MATLDQPPDPEEVDPPPGAGRSETAQPRSTRFWSLVRGLTLTSLLVVVTVAGWLAIGERDARIEVLAHLEGGLGAAEARRDSVRATLESVDETTREIRADLQGENDLGDDVVEALALLEQGRRELLASIALVDDQRNAATTERDQVLAALGESSAAYGAAQLEILAGLGRLDIQGNQVLGLSVCLEGVTAALNAYSVDDSPTAEAVLTEVAPACDYAVAGIIEGSAS